MILGLGIDLVEIERLQTQLRENPALAGRLFAPREIGLPAASLAARFAVKEALAKAVGDPRLLSWVEIELTKNELGKPELLLSGETARNVRGLGVALTHVSITHTDQTAAAVVILQD